MKQEEIINKYLKPEIFKKDGDKNFLSSILTGEMTAVSAYDKILEKFDNEPETQRLREFRMEHVSTASELQTLLETKGEKDIQTDSGLWGDITKTIMTAASLTGPKGGLITLYKGEEIVMKEYKEALDKDLSEDVKRYVKDILIPRQEKHLNSIAAMLKLQ